MTRPRPDLGFARRSSATAALVALAIPALAGATGGAYRESPHGNPSTGVYRVAGARRGACAQCHGAPKDGRGKKAVGRGHVELFAPNDNGLCFTCHRAKTRRGVYAGEQLYGQSGHATSPAAVWPGPVPAARSSADAGRCVNCHDPHGAKDAAGLVPAMLRLRGTALCLTCHDGSPATDIAGALSRTYRHPMLPDPAPAADVAGAPTPWAAPVSGAGTCTACHDPHLAAPDPVAVRAPAASRALLGATRVRVSNGSAGSSPLFSPVAAGDTTLVREYEICFKCHSTSGGMPPRGVDVAAELNPANASYHPVEATGRNLAIDRRAFAQGWSAERLVSCTDCHSSDAAGARGPHGSRYEHLLKKPYRAGPGQQPPAEGDLCFDCHAWKTYGDPSAGAAVELSRFPGHASHVARGASCWTCHDAHGSALQPALLVLRNGALTAYAQEPTGGSCTTSCHLTAPRTASFRAPSVQLRAPSSLRR